MLRLIIWLLIGIDIAARKPPFKVSHDCHERNCPECMVRSRRVDWYTNPLTGDKWGQIDRMTMYEKVRELRKFWQENLDSGGHDFPARPGDDIRDGFEWMLEQMYGPDKADSFAARYGRPNPCVHSWSDSDGDHPAVEAEAEWIAGLMDRDAEKVPIYQPYRDWKREKDRKDREEGQKS